MKYHELVVLILGMNSGQFLYKWKRLEVIDVWFYRENNTTKWTKMNFKENLNKKDTYFKSESGNFLVTWNNICACIYVMTGNEEKWKIYKWCVTPKFGWFHILHVRIFFFKKKTLSSEKALKSLSIGEGDNISYHIRWPQTFGYVYLCVIDAIIHPTKRHISSI